MPVRQASGLVPGRLPGPGMASSNGAAELGYAVTDHVAQGHTVTAGLAVITGTEDRPHA